jgi:ADP-ribose pyrophosphatase YjhB (NUDIX family)
VTADPIVRRAHRLALRTYRHLPRLLRRWIVRLLAPSYTVGAISVVERPDGHLLLVRQTYRTHWGVPGGLLKRGEAPEVGARREILEEVGINVELVGPPAVVVDAAPQRVDVIFRARPVTLAEVGEVRPTSPEIAEVGWFDPDALPQLQHETVDAMIALARQRTAPATAD